MMKYMWWCGDKSICTFELKELFFSNCFFLTLSIYMPGVDGLSVRRHIKFYTSRKVRKAVLCIYKKITKKAR